MQSANQQRRSFIGRIMMMVGLAPVINAEIVSEHADVGYGVIGGQSDDSPMMALGYVSRLLPDDYVHCQPPMKTARDIVAAVNGERETSERRQVALAGVSAVALGATGALNTAGPEDWAWHPAYQDALDLRRKFDAALRIIAERIPSGQQIMLYPCGCSALGNLPVGQMLPLDCGSDGHERGAASIVRGLPPKPRPTIADLEKILAEDGAGPPVIVLPSGEVTV